MKHLKLFFAILLPCYLVCSCGGDSAASSNSSQSSGDSTYTGNSSLSYTVEGRHIAIKDFMHDGDGKNWIALFINEVANKPGSRLKVNLTNELSKEVFDFSIANTGTTTISHYSPSLANFAGGSNEATYMSPKYKNYYGDSVSVTITSLDAKHVTGTFSGKFLSDDDKHLPLKITDGSFDLPFTKDNSN